MPLLQGVSLRQMPVVGHNFVLGSLQQAQNKLSPRTKAFIIFRLMDPMMSIPKTLELKRCLISQ